MREKRNLALAALAQTVAIILGRMPDQVVTFFDHQTTLFDGLTAAQWGNIAFATHLCNMLNFVADPIMTLIIVKPYRETVLKTWTAFKKLVMAPKNNRVIPLYSIDHGIRMVDIHDIQHDNI